MHLIIKNRIEIRLSRPDVPVRIRNRVVQIRVERATLNAVVRITVDMGEASHNKTLSV